RLVELIQYIHCYFLPFSPLGFDFWNAGPDKTTNRAGRGVLRLDSDPLSLRRVSKKSRRFVKKIRRRRESPIRVPETRSTFHPLAQRDAFRCDGALSRRTVQQTARARN